MTTKKRDFNNDAAAWDENPGRLKMAESVFEAIAANLIISRDMDIMDFGCGTGLLSLKLLPLVNSVTGADSSSGMLEVLNSKIVTRKLSGIQTLFIDIEKGQTLTGSFDIITSSMTMHHIQDPAPVLRQFNTITKPGGYLCIADLDPDDGKFHENSDGVFHKGFHREEMIKLFHDSGYTEIKDFTAAQISKPDKDGVMNNFSVFLIIGKKTDSGGHES